MVKKIYEKELLIEQLFKGLNGLAFFNIVLIRG